MLVRVGLDLDVLEAAATEDSTLSSVSAHRQALRLMVESGVLFVASSAERSRLAELVGLLPASLAKTWEVLTVDRRGEILECVPESSRPVCRVDDYEELNDIFRGVLDVALIEEHRAEAMGLSELQSSRADDAVEATRFMYANESPTFLRVREQAFVPKGTPRDKVFDHHLALSARTSTHIFLVDRYAGEQLIQFEILKDSKKSGGSWLLERIHALAGSKAYLTVVTQPPTREGPPARVIEAANLLAARLGDGAVREIRVRVHTQVPHDRHIRFGKRLAVAVGPGPSIWSTVRASQGYTLHRLAVADAMERERRETGKLLIDECLPVGAAR